jgi:uncharacterized protein
MLFRRSLLLLGLAFMTSPLHAQTGPQPVLAQSELFIESQGARHRFTVELADTDERRMIGLMFRTQMAPDAGMLFDFKRDEPVAMWMRNTLIPLDMVFIARDGRIVNIGERAVPRSEATVMSQGPVRFVLELNGGTAARLGIRAGDRVVHAAIRS